MREIRSFDLSVSPHVTDSPAWRDCMAMADRLRSAILRWNQGESEDALHDLCSAIDVTSKKVRNNARSSGRLFKLFLKENMQLVACVASGGVVMTGGIGCVCKHPEIKGTVDGGCGLEDVLYHAVRCGLYHDGRLPKDLVFHETSFFGNEGDVLYLNNNFVLGLIVAVIVSPVNRDLKIREDWAFSCNGTTLRFDDLWGIGADAFLRKIGKSP